MTEITGCSDCPFREEWDGVSWGDEDRQDEFRGQPCHIQLAKAREDSLVSWNDVDFTEMKEVDTSEVKLGETPDWCPLRQGPLTVRLAAQ